ncbi:hypothetical protein LCGC14_1379120 [marine sediment metagenome]|uniref:Uncharacterized protein n=1 Tax=marine sediment metagenome TaxID=412755 RepID=A0A0F9N4V4_9ZZZZ
MSIIVDAGVKFERLPQVLETYQNDLDSVEANLTLKSKKLEHANVEQPAWLSYYDERRIELRTLVKYLETKVAAKRGKLWIHFTEVYTHELGPRDKDQYINADEKYVEIHELFLEVEELYKKYDSVVEAFKARGFALRNITEIRVHSLEDAVI